MRIGVLALLVGGCVAASDDTPPLTATEHARQLAPRDGVMHLPALASLGEIQVGRARITRVEQRIAGLPVAKGELRVMTDEHGALVKVVGRLVGAERARPSVFAFDERGALERAVRTVHGFVDGVDVIASHAWQAWYPVGPALVAAWIVETRSQALPERRAQARRTVLAGDTGEVLASLDLTRYDAVTYRMWASPTGDNRPDDGPAVDWSPHPTGMLDGTFPTTYRPSVLVTLDPADPWLPDGASVTTGNNAEAYADVFNPDGFSNGDIRGQATGDAEFAPTYDTADDPLATVEQQQAAVVALFYQTNYFHDFWYAAGFTEAAGNAQDDNYGRGGIADDPILAEAQDDAYDGARDNANMTTFSDGVSPVMQVYLSTGSEISKRLAMVPGTAITHGTAKFGPRNFDLTAELATATSCSTTQPDLTGKIALAAAGACTPERQASQVAAAGAIGMVYVYAGASAAALAKDPVITDTLIPAAGVNATNGQTLTTALGAGPVTLNLARAANLETDADLDFTTAAHELGHYIHMRLQDCETSFCGAQSEGWGDFIALLMTVREGDDLDAVYPYGVWPPYDGLDDQGYFGIRRTPYSTQPTKNALTFRHMADGTPLPTGAPIQGFGPNSEVHNAGEVWATAMWEAYVALHRANPGVPFDELRQRMASYVVGGLLMSPASSTPTETRDGILAVARMTSPSDQAALAQGFARRGLGSCAVSPARDSDDFRGIVESTVAAGRVELGPLVVTPTVSCDADQALDVGETATLSLEVTNTGVAMLAGASLAITTTTPGLTLSGSGGALPDLAPGAATTITIDVALETASALGTGAIHVESTAPGACAEGVALDVSIPLEVDDVPASSATDAFDAPSIWTPSLPDVWSQRYETSPGLDRVWHADDLGVVSDVSLRSPVFTAHATTPLVITLQHRYQFDDLLRGPHDGGVIEVSTDGGTTWVDISTFATINYPGVIDTRLGNPLAGRAAFVKTSTGFPAWVDLRLDLGTALAGQTFQLRFRVGTDRTIASTGWDIDDVSFTGIVGTPFPSRQPDGAECEVPTDDDGMTDGTDPGDDGGCCQSNSAPSSLALGLGLLALSRRSRRARSR